MPLSGFPTLTIERSLLKEGHGRIAGVDEVGRGSLAGPVVAAAVILPIHSRTLRRRLEGLRDSKQLTPRQRAGLFERIMEVSEAIGVGSASHHAIDRLGIAAANRWAMERAVRALASPPDALILDAFALPTCPLPQRALYKADSLSLSVAAASVVAKVIRDRWMIRCDQRFPGYGFSQHKGYATAAHLAALANHGPCRLHRRSFAPIAVIQK